MALLAKPACVWASPGHRGLGQHSPRNAIKSSALAVSQCEQLGLLAGPPGACGGPGRAGPRHWASGSREQSGTTVLGWGHGAWRLLGDGSEGLCRTQRLTRHQGLAGAGKWCPEALRGGGRGWSCAETPSGSQSHPAWSGCQHSSQCPAPAMSPAVPTSLRQLPPGTRSTGTHCARQHPGLASLRVLLPAELEKQTKKISGERNTVAVIYLYFSTKFDTVFHKTLLKNTIQTRRAWTPVVLGGLGWVVPGHHQRGCEGPRGGQRTSCECPELWWGAPPAACGAEPPPTWAGTQSEALARVPRERVCPKGKAGGVAGTPSIPSSI